MRGRCAAHNMKIAPILATLRQRASPITARLVHISQHYDIDMNERFFAQLGIPSPDHSLEVGSASHAVQTAEIMRRFEPVPDAHGPVVFRSDLQSARGRT